VLDWLHIILFYHCTSNRTGCPLQKLSDGSSRKRRPRLRRLEDLEKDMREMKV